MTRYKLDEKTDVQSIDAMLQQYKPVHLFVKKPLENDTFVNVIEDFTKKPLRYETNNHGDFTLYAGEQKVFTLPKMVNKDSQGFNIYFRRKNEDGNLIHESTQQKKEPRAFESVLAHYNGESLFELSFQGEIQLEKSEFGLTNNFKVNYNKTRELFPEKLTRPTQQKTILKDYSKAI
jgi:hypothetical protein